MSSTVIRRFVLLVAMLAPPVIAQGPLGEPSAATSPASEAVAADLGRRLDALQGLLYAVRDTHGEPMRQTRMERHWKAMQDYMAASLKLADRDSEAADRTDGDCRVVGNIWTGLSFPGQVRSDDYLKAMQAHTGHMREDLLSLHAAQQTDALDKALRDHWQGNYQFLQTMRGLGWMFSSWTPAQPGDRHLPDPQSEGAKLTQSYCSICHAVPQTRLHTAAEWTSVMSTMSRHIASSDSGFPACVQVPSVAELETIGNYLGQHAR